MMDILDAIGNMSTQTDPRLYVTEFVYDNNRRKTHTLNHNGNIAAAGGVQICGMVRWYQRRGDARDRPVCPRLEPHPLSRFHCVRVWRGLLCVADDYRWPSGGDMG